MMLNNLLQWAAIIILLAAEWERIKKAAGILRVALAKLDGVLKWLSGVEEPKPKGKK